MNRQEEQLSSQVKGEEEGDGRAEALSVIGDEGKAEILSHLMLMLHRF